MITPLWPFIKTSMEKINGIFTSGNTLLRSIATKEYIAAHFHGLVSQTQNYWKIWSILKNPQGFLLIKAKRVRDFNLNMLSLNAEMQYMHAAMQNIFCIKNHN